MIYYNDFLWIGTSNGVSYTDSSFSFFKYFSQDNSELSNSHVTSLLGDEKIIWVGTYQGLNSISFVPFDNFNEQNSGVFNDVLAFEEDIDHNLWVGTFDGLYVYNEERKFHINFADIPGSGDLNDHRIMTISAKANELWLGFRRDGVQIVNTKSFHVTTPPIPALKQLEVTKIIHTERGQTWLATFNHGLYRIEGEKIYSYMPNGLPEESVTILLSKKTGGILAASEHNIYEYDEATDSFYPLKFDFGTGGGDPFVLSLSQSKNDDIWIGTKDRGLFIWRHREQKIKSLKLEHVSIDRDHSLTTVYEIQFDSEGHAWCSTQSGVLKLDLAGKTLARFSSSDGLQGSDFNFGASFRDSTGRLYFGGSNGYNRFSPKDIATNRSPPKLLITEVTISKDGKPKSFDGIMLKNVQLTHKDYFVQFEFSVLDFMDPEKNQYRYMLEGFDRDWVESGTRNSATYTSLPAGDYTLRVQGANSAGIWNREGLTLSVQVLPAPWLTWWAFSLYALGALLLIWLSTRAYVSFVIERRAMEMAVEMVEAEERADDEMQEQLEIHDDLVKSVYRHSVSTLNLVGELIATKSSYLTDDFACEVVRASINRVDALAILEECLYHKNETLLADLNKYTNILIANLLKKSPVGEENIITINEVSTQPLPIEQASPLAIALFELVENAIQHGFEETGRANYLHIVLAPDEPGLTEQTYRLVVQDNGPGIPPNIDPLAAETSGLAIVSSMARRLSGVLGFSNRNGTSVSIIFPKAEAG